MRENGFLEEEHGLGVVADVLKKKPSQEIITALATERVRDVVTRMKKHGISQIPVLDGGRLSGVVSEIDLLRHLVSGEHSLRHSRRKLRSRATTRRCLRRRE